LAYSDLNKCPTYPGVLLREAITATGLTKVEIADKLGLSPQYLYAILGGRTRITPDVADRLGKVFGDGPGIWLRTQADVDVWHAGRVDVRGIKTIRPT
jgi:antitoxin HigA-1